MDYIVDYQGHLERLGEMKSFYTGGGEQVTVAPSLDPTPIAQWSASSTSRARVAIYDAAGAAPRVEDITASSPREYIESIAARVYELARSLGGPVPYTVVREVAENLIHAGFAEPVVSIMDGGHTIRFADQGPGIPDKKKALMPGFTTASSAMKDVIRGVGSGLPIVKEFLSVSGGGLVIEDNLDRGTVVTVSARSAHPEETAPLPASLHHSQAATDHASLLDADFEPFSARPRLTTRQKQVLALVLESGSAGPSMVSRELGVGISTAYRDLASLEETGLIVAEDGKRSLTPDGLSYLSSMTTGL